LHARRESALQFHGRWAPATKAIRRFITNPRDSPVSHLASNHSCLQLSFYTAVPSLLALQETRVPWPHKFAFVTLIVFSFR
jgi:hypothetical protein